MLNASHALRSYQQVGAHAQVAAAEDPYRLVQLMLESAIERLAAARGHMERKEIAAKGEQLSRALAIVDSLNGSLDMEKGGEVSANLRSLYNYATRRLAEGNMHNDATAIDEVVGLLREIKAGWDGIASAARPGAASP